MAESLGLLWPEPLSKPHVGRPTTVQRWRQQIYLHLRCGRLDKLRGLNATQAPPHWHLGMDVDAESLVVVTSARAAASPAGDEEEKTTVEPDSKRRKRVKPCPRPYQLTVHGLRHKSGCEVYGIYDKQGWRNWGKIGVQSPGRPLGATGKEKVRLDEEELLTCSSVCLSLSRREHRCRDT